MFLTFFFKWVYCIFRSQTHFSSHTPPAVHPPASGPARTQEDAQHGQKAQKEAQEKKNMAASLRHYAHHPRGKRRRGRVWDRWPNGGCPTHSAARHPATGNIDQSINRLLCQGSWFSGSMEAYSTPLTDLPLLLSLVWGAKRTWRNLLLSQCSTQKINIMCFQRKLMSLW